MSLEETLAQANINMAGATDALNDVNGRIDAVQAAGVAAVASLAASMINAVHLDPLAGDDTAAGSEAAPLKSLNEVQRRTPMGSLVTVYLHNDLIFFADVDVHSTIIIRPANGVTMPRVSAGGSFVSADGTVHAYGLVLRSGGNILLYDVRVGLTQWSGPEPVNTSAALFKHRFQYDLTLPHIGLALCEFDPGASPAGAVNSIALSTMLVLAPVEISSMLGHWTHFATNPNGTNSQTVRQLITDLALV